MLLLTQEQADQLRAQITGATDADSFAAAALAVYRALPVPQRKQLHAAFDAHLGNLTA